MKENILSSAISLSHLYDWNDNLLKAICQEQNIKPEIFHMIFPNGLKSLAEFFLEKPIVIQDNLTSLPIHIKVAKLLGARLSYLSDNKNIVRKIFASQSISFKLSHIGRISDEIWNSIAHKSSGFDYYTRRLTLSIVYGNCLCHLQKSEEDIIHFMEKQLGFVGKIGKLKKRLCC